MLWHKSFFRSGQRAHKYASVNKDNGRKNKHGGRLQHSLQQGNQSK